MDSDIELKLLKNALIELKKAPILPNDRKEIVLRMRELGLSFRDINRETGIAFSTIGFWVNGKEKSEWTNWRSSLTPRKFLLYLEDNKNWDCDDIVTLSKIRSAIDVILNSGGKDV